MISENSIRISNYNTFARRFGVKLLTTRGEYSVRKLDKRKAPSIHFITIASWTNTRCNSIPLLLFSNSSYSKLLFQHRRCVQRRALRVRMSSAARSQTVHETGQSSIRICRLGSFIRFKRPMADLLSSGQLLRPARRR